MPRSRPALAALVLLLVALLASGCASGGTAAQPPSAPGHRDAAAPKVFQEVHGVGARRCADGKVRRAGKCVKRKRAGSVRQAAGSTPARHSVRTATDGSPIRWASCDAIPYYLDLAGAPRGWRRTVAGAFAKVSAASGYAFAFHGTTTAGFQDAENAIVLEWSDAARVPQLAGGTAGVAQTRWSSAGQYVGGGVAMDRSLLGWSPRTRSRVIHQILLHELAHVMGLDHVDDRRQIMNPVSYGDLTDYQNGDRAGLAAVGRNAGPCVPLGPPVLR